MDTLFFICSLFVLFKTVSHIVYCNFVLKDFIVCILAFLVKLCSKGIVDGFFWGVFKL